MKERQIIAEFGAPRLLRDMGILQGTQRGATEMIKELQNGTFEDKLKDSWLFSLEVRWLESGYAIAFKGSAVPLAQRWWAVILQAGKGAGHATCQEGVRQRGALSEAQGRMHGPGVNWLSFWIIQYGK